MTELFQKKCIPCEGGPGAPPPLSESKARALLAETKGWEVYMSPEPARISKKFLFKNFKEVMAFLTKVAMLAEQEGHHPDIEAHYREVTLTFTTHAIKGLSGNDFIMAAKVDRL